MMQLRLMMRPHGVVGAIGAVAGASALGAAYLPWYEVKVDVEMLGASQTGSVATLPGWESHPWGWLVPAVALAAIVVATSVAVDRPLPVAGDLLLACGVGLAVLGGIGALAFPPVARFDVAGSRLRELAGVTLPSDVAMSFSVGPSVGLWITLAGAALLVASGFATREL